MAHIPNQNYGDQPATRPCPQVQVLLMCLCGADCPRSELTLLMRLRSLQSSCLPSVTWNRIAVNVLFPFCPYLLQTICKANMGSKSLHLHGGVQTNQVFLSLHHQRKTFFSHSLCCFVSKMYHHSFFVVLSSPTDAEEQSIDRCRYCGSFCVCQGQCDAICSSNVVLA